MDTVLDCQVLPLLSPCYVVNRQSYKARIEAASNGETKKKAPAAVILVQVQMIRACAVGAAQLQRIKVWLQCCKQECCS